MTLTQTTLGARLRKARENCGMTQEEAAAAIGLSRTSLVQIEQGNRAVSTLELVQLARLYHQDFATLVADEAAEEEEDDLVALCRIHPELADRPEVRQEIYRFVELFEEGVELTRLLGMRPRALPPTYEVPEPANYSEAAKQGEQLALQERRRLNLGTRPIEDVAALLTSQGIWAAAAVLPDEFSGLFLHNRRIGIAVLINETHRRERRRFSYCHEYAHALLDRARPPMITGRHNATDFTEKRANAFAGAFLMPADGVCEILERLNKGGSSRETHWLWDVATENGEHFERRNEPGSQEIGYQDVAFLAHEFMVSYDAAVYRLSDMKYITRPEQSVLLELRDSGRQFMELLQLHNPEDDEDAGQRRAAQLGQPLLTSQIGRLAIEAYRREAISAGRLLEVCEKLRIQDPGKLLQLARAAQA